MHSAVLVDVLLAPSAAMVWTQNQVGFVIEMATDCISMLSHSIFFLLGGVASLVPGVEGREDTPGSVLNTAWEHTLAPSELGMY